jgi:BolA protein
MVIQRTIERKLREAMHPEHLEVINESGQHSVPKGSETHFKVVLVSPDFCGKRAVARHRMVYQLLADELAAGVHALALHTYTPEEWAAAGAAPVSPRCLGGSKRDA